MGGDEGRAGQQAQHKIEPTCERETSAVRAVISRRNFLFPTSFLFVPLTHTATPTDDTVNHRVADAGDAVAISNSDAEGPKRARQGRFERIERLLPADFPSTGTLAADISGWFQQISLGDGPAGAAHHLLFLAFP